VAHVVRPLRTTSIVWFMLLLCVTALATFAVSGVAGAEVLPGQFTITAQAGPGGSVSPPGDTGVDPGGSQVILITPDTGYHTVDVVVDDFFHLGDIPSYSFDNIDAGHTLTASFARTTYTITVTAGANGGITPGTGPVNEGDDAVYTITPSAGYHVADVLVDGTSIGPVTSHTFINVTATHTISATFARTTYTITVTAGPNGDVTPGTGPVNEGDDAVYTITPSAGYHVADVVVDGGSIGPVTSHTITNVTGTHTISASFAVNAYPITVTAGAHGSITPGSGSADYGSSPTYAITPDTGYHVADVVVDGASVGAVTSKTFSGVSTGHTISATFAINMYAITLAAGAHGSISPAGPLVVTYGSDVTLSFLPDVSYRVSEVTVDGVSQGAVPSFTFSRVTGPHSVSVTFVQGLATRLEPHSGPTTVTYGKATTIGARLLKSDGTPLAGGSVALWASPTVSGPWALVNTVTTSATTGAEGTCSVQVTPKVATFYSLRYTPAEGSAYAAALGTIQLVNVRPALGAPSGPSAVKPGKRFTVAGTLTPRITAGGAGVQIRVYRQKGKKWKPFSRVTAVIADSGSGSRYAARLKLGDKGTYRFRATFPAAAGWASGSSKPGAKTSVR
jgi:hypothetical protein